MRYAAIALASSVGIGATLLPATNASAESEFNIDISSITVQATTLLGAPQAFTGAGYSGRLALSLDGNSSLVGMDFGGDPLTPSGSLTGLTGHVDLAGGVVTGGTLLVTVTDASVAQSFAIDLAADPDSGISGLTAPFSAFALAENGTFSGPVFAGANVSSFVAAQPLAGEVSLTNYRPDGSGAFNNVILDINVVPEPAVGAMMCVGGILLAARRRRR